MRKYGKRRVDFMAVGTRNNYLYSRRNNKQFYDTIFGFSIDDALGVPYEFQERGSFLRISFESFQADCYGIGGIYENSRHQFCRPLPESETELSGA